jgi:maltose alpha-D-glucosyltransferase/alpha-amylase
LRGYLDSPAHASLVPPDKSQCTTLFRVLLLDQLLSEIAYELQFRPAWLEIPLTGLLEALSGGGAH